MNYRQAKRNAHREKCRRGGIRSGVVRRERMLLCEPSPRPRDDGEFIGVLEWRGRDEQLRRWVIRQGPRCNNLRIGDKTGGWDWFLGKLRKHLAPITRQAID